MKGKKRVLIILMIALFCCSNISLLFLSKNLNFNLSFNGVEYDGSSYFSQIHTSNKLGILEPPKEFLTLNQNEINDWENSIFIVDQNRNGISDEFEQKLNSLSKSDALIETSNDNKLCLTEVDIINGFLNNEKKSLEKLSYDNIPIIIQFPDDDFESYLALFTSLGGEIKSTYKSAIKGFAGSIDYNGFKQFHKFLSMHNKRFLIEEDSLFKANLYYTSRNMNLRPYTWNTLGYTGDEYSSVAVIDTGIDDTHNFFSPGYSSGNFNFKIVGWRDEVSGQPSPYDDNGHGSHCSGIITSVGGPVNDSNNRTVSTYSLGFDYFGYYVYEQTITITGARFNVTKPGTIEIQCQFNDYPYGADEIHVWAYLYHNETIVDSYISNSASWTENLSYTATASELGDYSLRIDLDFDDKTGDGIIIYPHMAFRGEVHWPFDPPLKVCGDPWKGIAPDTHLVGIKVLDSSGSGWVSDIINGIEWVIINKETYNITTISMSLGGPPRYYSIVEAVDNAVENGIVTCVSAGNGGGIGYNIGSPGDADKVITVAAMSYVDRVTEYSSSGGPSYSFKTTKPDIMAPGGSEYNYTMCSADTNEVDADGEYSDSFSNDLFPAKGTSMSAPAVAGAANLLIQAMGGHENWNYTETEANRVKALLLMTATETYPLKREIDTAFSPRLDRGGKDKHEGYGRLNIDAAIEAYTRELNISSNIEDWLSSSSLNSIDKHALGCYVDLLSGQGYNFHLLVPDGADFDLHLYSNTPTEVGDPIMEASSTSNILGKDETIIFEPEESGRYYLVAKAISGKGNATLIWNYMRLDRVKIGFVTAHGEDNPETKYPNIISGLQTRGATISNITSTINSRVLSNYDILWFDESGSGMDANEITGIKTWVRKGGALIITGEDNSGSANDIIEEFNISYSGMVGSGSTNSIYSHPVTIGVDEINFPSPAVSLDISSQPAAYSCVKLSGYDLVVGMESGKGKLLVIVDGNLLLNPELADNQILINNSFSWLGYKKSLQLGIGIILALTLILNQSTGATNTIIIILAIIIPVLIGVGIGFALYIRFYVTKPKTKTDDLKILKRRGDKYRSIGDFQKAIECYEKVLEINPQDKQTLAIIEILKTKTAVSKGVGEPYDMLTEIEKEEMSKKAEIWVVTGKSFLESKDYQNAIKYFKKATELAPRSKDAWFGLGLSYSMIGEVQNVIECNIKVIEIDPKFKPAYNLLGTAYLTLGNYQDSIKYYKKVVEIDPQDNNAQMILNMLKNKFPETISPKVTVDSKIEDTLKEDANKLYNMGNSFFNSGDYKKSIEYYEKAVQISPQIKDFWNKMGVAYGRLGNLQKMVECHEKASKAPYKIKKFI